MNMGGKLGAGRHHGVRAIGLVAAVVALVGAACGSSSTTPASSSGGSNTIPSTLSISSFNTSFSAMPSLKPLTEYATKGANTLQVGAILPTTVGSARYVDFDAPYLEQAFSGAGYSQAEFKIDNAQGSDATELADAEADITLGAKVLLMDPQDSTVGNEIQSYAAQHGVTLISYDRATFQGKNTYYVSFDNEKVGELIGQGFEQCVVSWGIKSPQVFELDGGENSDPNAISFADGYNKVIWGEAKTPLSSGITNTLGYTLVGDQIETDWVPATGQTIFQQQFAAHSNINAVVTANDDAANAVITDLKASGVPAKTIPTTGQDATLEGMENILDGYQCGSVYKPIYQEAQDAVALATILLAGDKVPSSLLNGTTVDPTDASITEPASLLTPTWVNVSNMASTVIKDNFISASALCAAVGSSVCAANNIPTS
jgi:D-xylose transport system substrate-binding protein